MTDACEPISKKQKIDEFTVLKNAADIAFSKGNYELAVEFFTKALEHHASDVLSLSNRSAAFFMMKQFDKAVLDASKCIEISPKWSKGYYRKASAMHALKNYGGAYIVCKKGLIVEPDEQNLLRLLNVVAQDLPVAIADLKNQGNAAFQKKDFKCAIDSYTKALALDPENAALFSNRSACHCSLKDYEEALKDALRCIKVDSEFGKGYSRKAAALHGLGRKQEALVAYRKGLYVDPSNKQMKQAMEDLELEVRGKEPEVVKQVYKLYCSECFQEGHIAHDCPKRKAAHAAAKKATAGCQNCGEDGHKSARCPYPRVITCRGCGAAGHVMRDCPNPSTPINYN